MAAALPPNPTLAVSHIAGGGGLEIEHQIVGDILALATLPARAEIAMERFRQARLETALTVLQRGAGTRRAYYRAVAARAAEDFLTRSQATAETAAQLSRRLGESGALNNLDQARNQVFDAELVAELATARRRTASEREHLIREMGLWGSDLTFRLPNALPPLPPRPRAWPRIEVEAVSRRVDLQVARLEVDALAKSYGLTGATRFLNLLDVSGVSKTVREPGTDRFIERGFAVELQVPLFDFGEARLREAEAAYMQAVNRLAAQAVNVRSEAREAYAELPRRPTTSPFTMNARFCRCARSSRMRRSCGTTPCRSMCLRCWPRPGSASPRRSPPYRQSGISISRKLICKRPIVGGGMGGASAAMAAER